MKTYSLDELTNKYLGKKGTSKRDQFEQELRIDLLGQAINQARLEQLDELVGVQKAQKSN